MGCLNLRSVLSTVLALGVLAGCGADVDAPPPDNALPTAYCPPFDEVAPRTIALIREGRLPATQRLLGERLSQDQLRAVLDGALRLVKGLKSDDLSALLDVANNDLIRSITPLLRNVLVYINGDPSRPETFRSEVLSESLRIVNQCDGEVLFGALDAFLSAPELPKLLSTLGETLELPLIQDLLSSDLQGALNREGFTALVCNVTASFIRPDFSVQTNIVDPLAGIPLLPLDMPPISTLLEALVQMFSPDQPLLGATADLICCDLYGISRCSTLTATSPLLNRDPVFTWLLYDLFVSAEVDFDQLLTQLGAIASDPDISRALTPVAALLREIAELKDLRDALAGLLAETLNPRTARELVPELILLLDEGVLEEALALIGVLGGCEMEELLP